MLTIPVVVLRKKEEEPPPQPTPRRSVLEKEIMQSVIAMIQTERKIACCMAPDILQKIFNSFGVVAKNRRSNGLTNNPVSAVEKNEARMIHSSQ